MSKEIKIDVPMPRLKRFFIRWNHGLEKVLLDTDKATPEELQIIIILKHPAAQKLDLKFTGSFPMPKLAFVQADNIKDIEKTLNKRFM